MNNYELEITNYELRIAPPCRDVAVQRLMRCNVWCGATSDEMLNIEWQMQCTVETRFIASD